MAEKEKMEPVVVTEKKPSDVPEGYRKKGNSYIAIPGYFEQKEADYAAINIEYEAKVEAFL